MSVITVIYHHNTNLVVLDTHVPPSIRHHSLFVLKEDIYGHTMDVKRNEQPNFDF